MKVGLTTKKLLTFRILTTINEVFTASMKTCRKKKQYKLFIYKTLTPFHSLYCRQNQFSE